MKLAILIASAFVAFAVPASADVLLFSNGAPIGAGSSCNSNGNTCGLSDPANGFLIVDSFTLNSSAHVTSLSYDSVFGSTYYASTNWWIWTSKPAGDWDATAAFSGKDVVGANCARTVSDPACTGSEVQFGFTETTITIPSGDNIKLTAGHQYWIGFQNNISDGNTQGLVSSYVRSDNSLDKYAFQATDKGGFNRPLLPASAFTINGNLGPVPEPSTWALMLLGFAGLCLAAYRRATQAAA